MANIRNDKRPSYVDIIESEFGRDLGARLAVYSEKLTLFIAHKDRNGNAVADIEDWIQRAEATLSNIGGGATSVQVRGAWKGGQEELIYEPTTLVYTYASPEKIAQAVGQIRQFATSYGEETGQGEVAVLLENNDGDWFFGIPFPDGDD